MFESKTWYKEVTILIVIPRLFSFLIFLIISENFEYPKTTAGLMMILIFVGLAAWRILRKKSTIKEVMVLILLDTALGIGSSLLLSYYLSPFLTVGLLFLIISRIHARAIKKVGDRDLTTPF